MEQAQTIRDRIEFLRSQLKDRLPHIDAVHQYAWVKNCTIDEACRHFWEVRNAHIRAINAEIFELEAQLRTKFKPVQQKLPF